MPTDYNTLIKLPRMATGPTLRETKDTRPYRREIRIMVDNDIAKVGKWRGGSLRPLGSVIHGSQGGLVDGLGLGHEHFLFRSQPCSNLPPILIQLSVS